MTTEELCLGLRHCGQCRDDLIGSGEEGVQLFLTISAGILALVERWNSEHRCRESIAAKSGDVDMKKVVIYESLTDSTFPKDS